MFGEESLVNCIYEGRLAVIVSAQMWSGDMAVTLLKLIIACMVDNSIAASIFSNRWISLKEGCMGHRLRRASTVATGLWDIVLALLCHLPGQCWMVKKYFNDFFLSLKRRWFYILLGSLSPTIPISDWWSVTITFVQPIMNMQHLSNAQAIAADSPSVGTYWCSASVQNLLPANTMRYPSGQHTRALSVGAFAVLL